MNTDLQRKLLALQEFLSLTPTEQQERIETEYRQRAPSRNASVQTQFIWHIETLEEQLSHLSRVLFHSHPSAFTIRNYAESLQIIVARLCIEYLSPIVPAIRDARFHSLWREFCDLVEVVARNQNSQASAVQIYRLMYLCALGLGRIYEIKPVIAKRFLDTELAVLFSKPGPNNLDFTEEVVATIVTESEALKAKLDVD